MAGYWARSFFAFYGLQKHRKELEQYRANVIEQTWSILIPYLSSNKQANKQNQKKHQKRERRVKSANPLPIENGATGRQLIAFDVGRTLPNTDLSRDFMGLVVDGSMDLGTHIWHPPQIFLQGWMTSQRERAW